MNISKFAPHGRRGVGHLLRWFILLILDSESRGCSLAGLNATLRSSDNSKSVARDLDNVRVKVIRVPPLMFILSVLTKHNSTHMPVRMFFLEQLQSTSVGGLEKQAREFQNDSAMLVVR